MVAYEKVENEEVDNSYKYLGIILQPNKAWSSYEQLEM